MHMHLGVVDFLVVGAYIIIWQFLLRLAELHWIDTMIGRALAFLIG